MAITSTTTIAHKAAGVALTPQPMQDLTSIIRVNRSEKAFGTSATSLISLPPGSVFARITNSTSVDADSYATVQSGRDARIELNSDLVFVNHSCDPSVEFDMTRFEVRVVQHRPLKEGDELTFFYPSSEWMMAQPFDCRCGAGLGKCLGRIEGAAKMEERVLRRYWLNDHVEELLAEREIAGKAH